MSTLVHIKYNLGQIKSNGNLPKSVHVHEEAFLLDLVTEISVIRVDGKQTLGLKT